MPNYENEWRDYRHYRNVFILAFVGYMPVVGTVGYVGFRFFNSSVSAFLAWVGWAAILVFTGGRLFLALSSLWGMVLANLVVPLGISCSTLRPLRVAQVC